MNARWSEGSESRSLQFEGQFLADSRVGLYTDRTLESIFSEIDDTTGTVTVDLGSGSGYFMDRLLDRFPALRPTAVALDIDPALLARQSTARRVQSDTSAVPFRDGSVDLVIAHFVLSRMSRQKASASLAEMARILRGGGRVLLLEPCLGMATYHSDEDPHLGSLVAMARRAKAEFQLSANDVDENYGLRLAAEVGKHLTVGSFDLHVARWYSTLPHESHRIAREILQRRLHGLRSDADGMRFLNSHGLGLADAAVSEAPGSTADVDERPMVTSNGLRLMQAGRARDIARSIDDPAVSGPVELIPVVRVVAYKDAR
jgi:SAM-dependent methyltransferase